MLPKSLVGINSVPRILNQAKIFFQLKLVLLAAVMERHRGGSFVFF